MLKITIYFGTLPNNEIYEFFIPFTNLPQNQLLRTLRLDFPACEGCEVELLDAKLIEMPLDDMVELTPNLITYRLWNSVFDTHIPRDIVKRLLQDPLFLFLHLILLTTTTMALVWSIFITRDCDD